jgi:hypothetical protein
MADPNALRNFLAPSPMPARGLGSGAAISTDDDGTLMPEGRRKLRTVGGSMLDMPSSTNALANVTGPPPDSGQPANALNPGVYTPFGWLPAGLASQLADYFTPTRQGAASWLGAPVDGAASVLNPMLNRFGLDIPGRMVDGVSIDGSPQHWETTPNVPLGVGFFNNLLGDAGNVSTEAWRRMRR